MAPGAIKSDESQNISQQNQNHSNSNTTNEKKQFNATSVEVKSKGLGAGAKEGLEGGKTFARQHELPKLPIPKLEDTCQRYLTSLQPLQVSDNIGRCSSEAEGMLEG
jgi:carnitine O-acetyltransferase